MNALFLTLTAIVVFIFGYRFYSKLLALGVFRLDNNYSIPASDAPTEDERRSIKRHLVFGHHVASLAAAGAVLGGVISLLWGWVPAFLWAVVATVTAAGTFGLGWLWLSLRYPGLNPAEIAARQLGPSAHHLFAFLAFLLLLVVNATCITLAAQLLTHFPQSVLPFWSLTLLAWILGTFLRGRENREMLLGSVVALVVGIIAIWLLGQSPLSLTGALNVDTPKTLIAFDSTLVWGLILLVYSYHATRQPMWKVIRPRGYLTSLLLVLMLGVFLLAVVVDHPMMVTPPFQVSANRPDTLPWLFITLTSGAVAGIHLLIANGITARQLKGESDVRYMGYGGALALGVLAISAIVIAGTQFAESPEWSQAYSPWEDFRDLHRVLGLYANGYAQLVAHVGFDPAFARTLATVVLLGLLMATVEAGLRVQKHLLTSLGERAPTLVPASEKHQVGIVVLATALLALHDAHGLGGLLWWPIVGVVDQILLVVGFLLLVLALRERGQAFVWVLAPLLFLAVTTHWALVALVSRWWAAGSWGMFGITLLLLAAEGVLVVQALKSLKAIARTEPEITP